MIRGVAVKDLRSGSLESILDSCGYDDDDDDAWAFAMSVCLASAS